MRDLTEQHKRIQNQQDDVLKRNIYKQNEHQGWLFCNSDGGLSFARKVSGEVRCIRDSIRNQLCQHQLSIKFGSCAPPHPSRPSNFNLRNGRLCRHLCDAVSVWNAASHVLARFNYQDIAPDEKLVCSCVRLGWDF